MAERFNNFRSRALLAIMYIGGPLILFFILEVVVFNRSLTDLFTLVEEYDVGVVSPRERPLYVRNNSKVSIFNNVESKEPSLILNPIAVAYEITTVDGWTHIEVYGWVWSQSLMYRGNARTLSETLESENMRVSPNTDVIATVLPSAIIEPLSVSESDAWVFCKIAGWVNANVLTQEEPKRGWFGVSPVTTIAANDGSVPSKRRRVLHLRENTLMLYFLLFMGLIMGISLCARLLRDGKLFGHDIHQQIHTGDGDNISGNKVSNAELNDNGRT